MTRRHGDSPSIPQLASRLAVLAWLCAAFFGGPARLAYAGDTLPVITSHSDLEFSVYKGDTVGLSVKAAGQGLEYKWVRANNTVCRAEACEIDTNDWPLGTQKVSFVVFNSKGSLYLRFKIRILVPPAGYQAGRVHPPMRDAGEGVETVTNVDLAVRTLSGRGFSYHFGKLQVVGPAPRALDWAEKLRTQGESTMQISRQHKEQHVLGFGTSVYLAKSETGRRVIVLNRGTLRSRQLDGKEPYWSVLVGQWLQIDADDQGDILVDRPNPAKDLVRIVVLRGRARVFRKRAYDGGNVKPESGLGGVTGDAFALPAGSSVTITREINDAIRIEQPSSKTFGNLVAMTTPFYMPGKDLFKESPESTVLGEKAPKKFSEAAILASEAAARRDPAVTIEALKPFASEARKSFRASLALGMAYRMLLQPRDATRYLEVAAKLKRDEAEPEFQLGELALSEGQWRNAARHFDRADALGYENRQTLLYYEGVAAYFMREFPTARANLEESLWAKGDERVAQSAAAFHRKVRNDGWFELRLGAGAIYDSNVLRLSKAAQSQPLPQGIKKNKAAGFEGRAGFSLWGFKGSAGSLGLHFDAAKQSWFEPTLRGIATTREILGIDFALASGTTPDGESEFEAGFGIEAGTLMIGDHRALDMAGGNGHMTIPGLWHLNLTARSMLGVDPFPYREDVIDPILLEVAPATDRSNREISYGAELTPLYLDTLKLGAGAKGGDVTMRNESQAAESFAFSREELNVSFEPLRRTAIWAKFGYLTRTFDQAEDHRKDGTMEASLGWTWHYSTGFYHVLDFTYENQKSSRAAASYGKSVAGFHLNLTL